MNWHIPRINSKVTAILLSSLYIKLIIICILYLYLYQIIYYSIINVKLYLNLNYVPYAIKKVAF